MSIKAEHCAGFPAEFPRLLTCGGAGDPAVSVSAGFFMFTCHAHAGTSFACALPATHGVMATEQTPQGAAAAPAAEPSPAAEPASGEAAAAGAHVEPPSLPELPLFSCKEAYVYRVPPATTAGHRAEMWDVNKWLATVALRVVQADDDAFIRLLDEKTGGLGGGDGFGRGWGIHLGW